MFMPRPARMTTDFVPKNYAELFEHYYIYVVGLVYKHGIDQQSTEDVAMAILAKFLENKVLEDFDPEHTSNHSGVTRTAMFRTFLSGFVVVYVRHHRDMQAKNAFRSAISTDKVLTSWVGDGDCLTVGEMLSKDYIEEYEDLTLFELQRLIHAQIAITPPSNAHDRCPMHELFDMVSEMTRLDGKPHIPTLAAHFGVSTTSVQNWMKRLKAIVTKVTVEPVLC